MWQSKGLIKCFNPVLIIIMWSVCICIHVVYSGGNAGITTMRMHLVQLVKTAQHLMFSFFEASHNAIERPITSLRLIHTTHVDHCVTTGSAYKPTMTCNVTQE